EVQSIPLGLAQPIAETIDNWRHAVQREDPEEQEIALKLRKQLWARLDEHLAGATTILVSPDGALSRFPLGALLARDGERRLIEEASVAVVPVPQLLAGVRPKPMGAEEPERKENGKIGGAASAAVTSDAKPSLLVVGNVDFDADPGPPATQP